MQVSISTGGGQFKAQLRLPRALVLSAAVTVAGFVAEAIRCESNIRELRAELAQCQQKPAAPAPAMGGQ
jgi:hypothetical protein